MDTGGSFDFDSQSGVTHLLASIRASAISPAQKNELRDIVFLYANGGHDASVKISLEQKLVAYNIQPAPRAQGSSSAPTPAPAPVGDIGTFRLAPSFAVSKPVSAPVQSAPPAPVAPVAPVVPPPAPVPPPVAPPVTAVPPTPVPPIPEVAAPPVAPVVPETANNQDENLQRIKEIKSLVNQKIGNPVNLVDIDNEVGREYMGALLDAMKKLNSGTSAIAAMKRLEVAYLSVEEAIKKHNAAPVTATVPVQSAPPAPVAPVVPPPVPTPAPQPPVAPVPPPAPTPVAPPPVPQPSTPVQPVSVPISTPTPVVPKPETNWSAPETAEPRTAWESEKPKTTSFADTKIASLGQTAETAKKPEVPLASTLKADEHAGDPLYTKEVDAGLEQLLSEWSLFKKSGLFGTGPKGREHPLFKKIAGLQIPLLLAGRFEGATQEIKQSITDYMNGWRYEQGMIYMQGETFERYLRRVIKHILDLQKKKPNA